MVFLLAASAARAEIKVQTGVEARETYTDNVNLASDSSSNGQFVTEVLPSVSVFENGPRLKLRARAVGHLYAYSGDRPGGTSSSTLDLYGNGQATVINDLFYVDGSVNRSRQAISLLGQQNQSGFGSGFGSGFNNGYATANTDTIITYSISPYLVHRFGTFASGQLRYTHDGVDAQNLSQYKSTGDALSLNLSSGPKFTRFGWQLNAYHQELKDYTAGNSQVETISGTLRYIPRNDLSLYTTAGYDKYTYEGLGGTTEGKNYSVGFTWTPSLRTSVDASVGRRFFGKTYSLAASHRSRNTVFSTTYREDITTTRAQFLLPGSVDTATLLDASFASAFPNPVERRQAIEAYIRALGLPTSVANNQNFLSNRLFLQKQFQASAVVNGSRSTAIFSFDNTKRTALSSAVSDTGLPSAAIPAFNDNTRGRSYTAALNYRLTSRSSATLNATKLRNTSLDTGIESDQTLLSLIVSKQFDRTLSGSLELRHSQGSTYNQSGGFRENAISASLSYRL